MGVIARESIRLQFEDGTYTLLYGNVGDRIELGAAIDDAHLALYLNHVQPDSGYYNNISPELYQVYSPAAEVYNERLSWSALGLRREAVPEGGILTGVEGMPNTLTGNAGSDVIIGASGSDVLAGGPGNDTLDGGDGADRYLFNVGDGVDVIDDSGVSGDDTLVFGAGIHAADITLGIGSLLLRIGDGGDAIHIDGFDTEDALVGGIEYFEFADGTRLTHAELVSRGFDLYGTDEARHHLRHQRSGSLSRQCRR